MWTHTWGQACRKETKCWGVVILTSVNCILHGRRYFLGLCGEKWKNSAVLLIAVSVGPENTFWKFKFKHTLVTYSYTWQKPIPGWLSGFCFLIYTFFFLQGAKYENVRIYNQSICCQACWRYSLINTSGSIFPRNNESAILTCRERHFTFSQSKSRWCSSLRKGGLSAHICFAKYKTYLSLLNSAYLRNLFTAHTQKKGRDAYSW